MNKEMKSDFITIGKKINDITNLKLELSLDEEDCIQIYKQLGEDYVDFTLNTFSNLNIHLITKYLMANRGFCNISLIDFITTNNLFKEKTIITNNISIVPLEDDLQAQCTLKLFNNVNYNYLRNLKEKYGFYIEDMSALYNTFIVLDNFISLKENSGKKLIQNIQKNVHCPILLQAGFLKYGDYVLYEESGDFSIVNNLVNYYEKLGFKNVKNQIGCYEESIIMLYEK